MFSTVYSIPNQQQVNTIPHPDEAPTPRQRLVLALEVSENSHCRIVGWTHMPMVKVSWTPRMETCLFCVENVKFGANSSFQCFFFFFFFVCVSFNTVGFFHPSFKPADQRSWLWCCAVGLVWLFFLCALLAAVYCIYNAVQFQILFSCQEKQANISIFFPQKITSQILSGSIRDLLGT